MTQKKHIYLVPGLAADISIFEYLRFPDEYELHYVEWEIPLSENESLDDYCLRLAEKIEHPNSILIGVSFGGIIVQELKSIVRAKQVFIISSIKSRNEMPLRLKLLQKTQTYKLFPTGALVNLEDFTKYAFGDMAKRKMKQYKKYLSVRDQTYLNWAIHNVLHWSRIKEDPEVIHIHGNKDHVFPSKNLKNFILVEEGTHAMVLMKAKKISAILQSYLSC